MASAAASGVAAWTGALCLDPMLPTTHPVTETAPEMAATSTAAAAAAPPRRFEQVQLRSLAADDIRALLSGGCGEQGDGDASLAPPMVRTPAVAPVMGSELRLIRRLRVGELPPPQLGQPRWQKSGSRT